VGSQLVELAAARDLAREQLRVTEATLETRQNSLNLAQRQFETGYTSRLEWMPARCAASVASAARMLLLRLPHKSTS
jgi:multidrug efflux system outer membrane protein